MSRIFLTSMNLWGIFDPDYNTWHPEVKIRYLRRQRKMLFILIALISVFDVVFIGYLALYEGQTFPPFFFISMIFAIPVIAIFFYYSFELKIRAIEENTQYLPATFSASGNFPEQRGPNYPAFCGNCGQPIVKGTSVCSRCGKRLP